MNEEAFRSLYPEAFEYLRDKKIVASEAFYARIDSLAKTAWTLSKLNTIAKIEQVKESLVEALASGKSFHSWQKDSAQLASLPKHYRETVFRNAVLGSYNGAKWSSFRDSEPKRPILRYSAINDSRTRPSHHALHGFMAAVDDIRWQTIAPANGHNCRCTLISLTERQARAFGYKGAPEELPTYEDSHGAGHACHADNGWEHSPEKPNLFAILQEREQKAGLSKAIYDSGKKQESGNYKPEKPVTNSVADWAIYDVVVAGQADGLEHGIIIDRYGKRIDKRVGDEGRISYTDLAGEQALIGATLYHNHPSGMTLSVNDVLMAAQSQLSAIVATGTFESAIYSAQILREWHIIYATTSILKRTVNVELKNYHKAGLITKDEACLIRAHVYLLYLDNKGYIDYNWDNKSKDMTDFLARNKKIIKDILGKIK